MLLFLDDSVSSLHLRFQEGTGGTDQVRGTKNASPARLRTNYLHNGPDVSYGQSEYKRSNGYKHGGFRKSSYNSNIQPTVPKQKYVSVRHVYPIPRVNIEHPVQRIRNVQIIENPNDESAQWIKMKKIFQNFPGTQGGQLETQERHYVVSSTIEGEDLKTLSIKPKMKQAEPDKMIMIVDNKITQMDEDDKEKGKFRNEKLVFRSINNIILPL